MSELVINMHSFSPSNPAGRLGRFLMHKGGLGTNKAKAEPTASLLCNYLQIPTDSHTQVLATGYLLTLTGQLSNAVNSLDAEQSKCYRTIVKAAFIFAQQARGPQTNWEHSISNFPQHHIESLLSCDLALRVHGDSYESEIIEFCQTYFERLFEVLRKADIPDNDRAYVEDVFEQILRQFKVCSLIGSVALQEAAQKLESFLYSAPNRWPGKFREWFSDAATLATILSLLVAIAPIHNLNQEIGHLRERIETVETLKRAYPLPTLPKPPTPAALSEAPNELRNAIEGYYRTAHDVGNPPYGIEIQGGEFDADSRQGDE